MLWNRPVRQMRALRAACRPLGQVKGKLNQHGGWEASYWALDAGAGLHEDFVWIYRSPLPESQKVAGLACFYNEKVDIVLDGERQERPRTPFS